jgi:hypothetical protein
MVLAPAMHALLSLHGTHFAPARSTVSMEFDLDALSARISEIESKPEPEVVRVLIQESMVPGQRLALECDDYWAPAGLIQTIDIWENMMNQSIVMVGHDSGEVNSHGVEVTLERNSDWVVNTLRADGSAMIELVAGRYAEVVHIGEDEGNYLRDGVHRNLHPWPLGDHIA